MSAGVLESPSKHGHRSLVAPAHIGAVHWAALVQGEVPLARRVLLIVIEPNLGGVVSLAAVDVEEFSRVGYGGDPVCIISQAIAELGEGWRVSLRRTSIGRCRS